VFPRRGVFCWANDTEDTNANYNCVSFLIEAFPNVVDFEFLPGCAKEHAAI